MRQTSAWYVAFALWDEAQQQLFLAETAWDKNLCIITVTDSDFIWL
jgi:hypothetical protein